MAYVYLVIAIVAEVIGTNAMVASDGFSKIWPSSLTVVGYAISFYCLSLVLKTIPVGIAYAIWSGMGIVLVTAIAVVIYKQVPDWLAMVGMTLIVSGVVVIQLFSKMSGS